MEALGEPVNTNFNGECGGATKNKGQGQQDSHTYSGAKHPEVQVVFADSRKFAEEWTYRFLAAALADSIGSDVAR